MNFVYQRIAKISSLSNLYLRVLAIKLRSQSYMAMVKEVAVLIEGEAVVNTMIGREEIVIVVLGVVA